ncbi:hypothetical protein B0H67DRAFT_304974 [Lasiosphaeris hirsuta]|uniref:Uncharacterized protein n=1 Tax=Lasiosphaeris hirsuta TaxID=260670 RepID=A0AA40A9Z9_9PEZI|nr:hypothetical protein B0H67DRAFT_304974 [Lasiosphaeris hirsuta]
MSSVSLPSIISLSLASAKSCNHSLAYHCPRTRPQADRSSPWTTPNISLPQSRNTTKVTSDYAIEAVPISKMPPKTTRSKQPLAEMDTNAIQNKTRKTLTEPPKTRKRKSTKAPETPVTPAAAKKAKEDRAPCRVTP